MKLDWTGCFNCSEPPPYYLNKSMSLAINRENVSDTSHLEFDRIQGQVQNCPWMLAIAQLEIRFSNNIFHLSGQLELSRAGRRCLDVCMGKFIVGLKLMVAREGLPPSRPPDGFAGKLQVVDVMERPVEMQKIIMGSNSHSIFWCMKVAQQAVEAFNLNPYSTKK